MLAGFSGQLVASRFLEQQIARQDSPIDAARCARALREWRATQQSLGPASSLRAMLDAGAGPLAHALGFETVDDLLSSDVQLSATLRGAPMPVALVVTRWGEPLDRAWRRAVVHAVERRATWCVLFNGTHVRLVHAGRVFSRRFADFELDAAADEETTAAAMRTLIGAEAFAQEAPGETTRLERLVADSDRHASSMCRSLRQGVLQASEHVLGALLARPAGTPVEEAFGQALTIVYRILFLLFAEARGLVPVWHPTYRAGYSIEVLSDKAGRRSTAGLWESLRAISRLAYAGCVAGDLRVTPFNGRLFAPSRTPLAERQGLNDEAARRTLLALSTRPATDGEGRERIDYGDLGVEQLGEVYETLLDYSPDVSTAPAQGRSPAKSTISLRRGSGLRKSTGSFYTPRPIASYLVDCTLGPLVLDRTPEGILDLRVLDPAMGSGAFLVGACHYLAESYEGALVRAGRCHATDIGPEERAGIRRTIAERCLYGVDLNPMAVQLARLSLWLATLAADRPLSFLDHHLQTGDSLLGAWVSCVRRPPTSRRHRTAALPLFPDAAVGDALRSALPVRFRLALEPNDTAAQVRAKEQALTALSNRDTALSKWRRVADLWCARWFAPDLDQLASAFSTLSDAILSGRSSLPDSTTEAWLARGEAVASDRRFFHWELEFPEVFFDAAGQRRRDAGFDAILGNPPWDMIRADRPASDVTGTATAARASGGEAQVVRFVRDGGVYEAQAGGHLNRYQLFVERTVALTRPGGRIGLVVPWGLAADHGSAALRHMLFSRCAVERLVGFDNRLGIFPIHRSTRFLLMSATKGEATTSIACRLGQSDPTTLESSGTAGGKTDADWFPVTLTPAHLQTLSGPDLSIPDLRTPQDLVIAERAARLFAPLAAERGWRARFGRELNATEDRQHFGPPGRALPVVEGKLLAPFRVRTDEARFSITSPRATRLLGDRYTRARLAYRDVASATNRLTLIAALLPAGCVSTHTVFCLTSPLAVRAQQFLCGLFNSLVVNYLVRLRVTTHVTTAIAERLPLPREDQAGAAFGEISAIARVLRGHDDPALFARLNARVARLYELTEDEFTHVLGTFPLIATSEREAALAAFRRV